MREDINYNKDWDDLPDNNRQLISDAMRYVRAIVRRSWLIVITALIVGGIAYYVRSNSRLSYTSEVRIFIGNIIDQPNPDSRQIMIAEQLATIYAEMARSYEILNFVLEELEIDASTEQLSSRISTRVVEDTPILILGVTVFDPQQSADIANVLATKLLEESPIRLTEAEQEQLDQLRSDRQQIEAQIAITNEQAVAKLKELNTAQVENESPETIESLSTEYYRLVDQLNSARSTLAQLSTTFVELSGRINELKIIESARPGTPNEGLSPRIVAIAGVLAGAMIGVSMIVFLEYSNNTIRDEDEAFKVLNLPCIGTVKKQKSDDFSSEVLKAESPLGESYRSIRVNLVSQKERGPYWIIISPKRGNGRTFTTANLGLIMSESEQSTLLVDADLRHPSLHNFLGLDDTQGLAQLLEDNPEELDDKTIEQRLNINLSEHQPHLNLITCGLTTSKLTGNLLSYNHIMEWLQTIQAKHHYKYIFFDTAACQDVSDAYTLATKINANILLVIEAGKTTQSEALRVKRQLETVGIQIYGTIVNKA